LLQIYRTILPVSAVSVVETMRNWFSRNQVDDCRLENIGENAQVDIPLAQEANDLSPEIRPELRGFMDIEDATVDNHIFSVAVQSEGGNESAPGFTEPNGAVVEASEYVQNETEVLPSVETDRIDTTVVEKQAVTTSEAGSVLDEDMDPHVTKTTKPSSPLRTSEPRIGSPASESVGMAVTDTNQGIADKPIERTSPIELDENSDACLQPDYHQELLDTFINKGFTPQTSAQIMAKILDYAVSIKADLENSQQQNQALYNNMVTLDQQLSALNQNYDILATKHENFSEDFANFQKRQSQRKIRKDIDDAKKELATLAVEVQKLREPDITIEHLSKDVTEFETRFTKMKEDVIKEIKASKEARAGVIKEKKRNTEFAKNMDNELSGLREEVNEIINRLDSIDENTEMAAKEAVHEAQIITDQAHNYIFARANVDELALVKEELIDIRQELAEAKQGCENKDDQLQNDLDVLRDHVTSTIRNQALNPNTTIATAGTLALRNDSPYVPTPEALSTLKTQNGLMGQAVAAIIEGQDAKNAALDDRIGSLGKRTRTCWEAVHTVSQQTTLTQSLAVDTATAVNRIIRDTAAQVRRVERALDSLDDRIVALAKPVGGEPVRKKLCGEYVGVE
jgi:hypothetical protein